MYNDKDQEQKIEPEYNAEFEHLLVSFMVSDFTSFTRCRNILSAQHFSDPATRKAVKFIIEYVNERNVTPTANQVAVVTGKTVEQLDTSTLDLHRSWFLDNIEQFCRHKALSIAISESSALLNQGRYGEVEAKIKAAVQIGLVKDLGTDYYHDPYARLFAIKNDKAMVSTGWESLDKKIYGGFNRGELSIFAGQSGAGKSIFLQNLALNWVEAGMNVIYISLELSERLLSLRIDAMTTGIATKDVLTNIEETAMKITLSKKKHKGDFRVKQLKNGCTANDVRAFIREVEIATNRKVDACLFDYLDLAMPMGVKVNPSDAFTKDKYVSEELRNLAGEMNILLVSATQLNRGSYGADATSPAHISGGISKMNTCDNLVSIMPKFDSIGDGSQPKVTGYELAYLKTRSSSGVGSKTRFGFDNQTLRLSGTFEDDRDDFSSATIQQTIASSQNNSQPITSAKTLFDKLKNDNK